MGHQTKMVEMNVVRLDTDSKTRHEMVWLQSVEHDLVLPIVIGHTEFMAIYSEMEGKAPPRPLTHDLLRTILDHFGARVERTHIVDLKDGIFYAELVVSSGGELLHLDARPSDSIALALKYGAPLYMSEEVLKAAGIKISSKQAEMLLLEASNLLEAEEGSKEAISETDVVMAVEGLLKDAGLSGLQSLGEADVGKRIALLKKRMSWAVQREHYEEAGQLRDEIAKLEINPEDG